MPPKKRTQSGFRSGAANARGAENLRGWVQLTDERWAFYVNPDDPNSEERGEQVVLLRDLGRTKVPIDLTRFTEQELTALRLVILRAFDAALPLVQQRDEDARNAADDPVDGRIQFRLYRPVPRILDVERSGREHVESVHVRPQPVSAAVWQDDDREGPVRDRSDVLAEDVSVGPTREDQSEDDPSPFDQPAEVREGDLW